MYASKLHSRIFKLNPFKIKINQHCQVRSTTTSLDAAKLIGSQSPKKWVGRWLFGCSGMVFGAVAIGGLTRLTESGLSMTDWHLLGKRPPWTEEQWTKEFLQYQQYPEFMKLNSKMTLNEFKFIWWMEYGHRQWGRTIGAFFAIPAAYFWYKGALSSVLKKRVVLCGALIGFQGLLGWYMVKSGLEHERFEEDNSIPRVSQYRLMSHLGSAFVLYSLFLWNALEVSFPAQKAVKITEAALKFRKFAHLTKGWIFFTAMSGALVAGLDAGLVYSSFPKMGDHWIPPEILRFTPKLINFTENPVTVQFDHRILGTTSLVLATTAALVSRRMILPGRANQAALALGGLAWMQVGLGISTLITYVPVWLASMHQCGSLITLSAAIWLTHELKHVRRFVK